MSDPLEEVEQVLNIAILVALIGGLIWGVLEVKKLFHSSSNPLGVGPAGSGIAAIPLNAAVQNSPVAKAIFSSGDDSNQSWLTGGPFNDGSGNMGNLWNGILSLFGYTAADASIPETNQQGAQEVGIASASPWVTGDPLASQFNLAAPMQGGS